MYGGRRIQLRWVHRMSDGPRGEWAAVEPGPEGANRGGFAGLLGKVVAAVFLLVGLVLLGRYAGGHLPAFSVWVQSQGAWGVLAFVLGYAVATVAFVPGSLLTLAGGAIFGFAAGTAYVFAGAVLGSSAAFLVARYVARPAVERRLARDPRFERIDAAVGRDGRKMVFLLRLSPLLPYNALNYALGLTSVRFRDYVLASVGMLPATVMWVYAGRLAGDLASVAAGAGVAHGPSYYLMLAVGLAATLAVILWVTRLARRALAEETA
jgi:uncharacterized membrane protein YdjX (TVP38/TMEM64 family)